MSLYSYMCAVHKDGRYISTLVIFSGRGGLSGNAIETAIAQETDRSLSPECVFIITPEISDEINNQVCDVSNYHSISSTATIGLYTFDKRGDVTLSKAIRNPQDLPFELPLEQLRRQGMTILFRRRNGLVESGPTAHFVKPSGARDSQFLIGAHALSDSAEIFFIAFWLLRHIADYKIEYVHVDTSGIASVGLALSLLSSDFMPVIRTFESYDGVHKIDTQPGRDDLILISASQSGGMAEKIKESVKNDQLIITLFSLSPNEVKAGHMLCDLNYDPKYNVHGYNVSSKNIDADSTSAIRLAGERFMTEVSKPRKIIPTALGAPDVVKEYLEELVGKQVFSVFKFGLGGEERGIWIDVSNLLKTKICKEWVAKVVSSKIPVATKATITFDDDPASNLLAKAIRREVKRQGVSLDRADKLTLTSIQKEGSKAKWPVENSAVLIIGGATGHGAELLAASRALRTYAEKSHRIYITAAAVPSSSNSFKILNSNLVFPKHSFETMFQLIVDRVDMTSSWKRELELLRNAELPAALEQRRSDLMNTSTGLQKNLFIPSPNDELFLRKNFAFWSKELSASATQADVFTTIAVIVENLRTSDKISQDKRLTNTPYTRSIITAETFSRYNDGVIQASILRAAKPIELNYKDSEADSRLMANLIIDMGRLATQPQGEALSEFLLALKTKRLLLTDEDNERLLKKFNTDNLDEVQLWFFEALKNDDKPDIASEIMSL